MRAASTLSSSNARILRHAHAAPIASATLTSSIACSVTSTLSNPTGPPRRCPCRHRHRRCLNRHVRRPRFRHHRHLPRRKPLFGAIEGTVLLLLLLCCPLAPWWRWCELQRKVARDLAHKRE